MTRQQRGYSSEVIAHGEKESTPDSKTKGQDLSGRKRRQNRAVPFGQGSSAAQKNGRRRNHHKEVALVLAQAGRAARELAALPLQDFS